MVAITSKSILDTKLLSVQSQISDGSSVGLRYGSNGLCGWCKRGGNVLSKSLYTALPFLIHKSSYLVKSFSASLSFRASDHKTWDRAGFTDFSAG